MIGTQYAQCPRLVDFWATDHLHDRCRIEHRTDNSLQFGHMLEAALPISCHCPCYSHGPYFILLSFTPLQPQVSSTRAREKGKHIPLNEFLWRLVCPVTSLISLYGNKQEIKILVFYILYLEGWELPRALASYYINLWGKKRKSL